MPAARREGGPLWAGGPVRLPTTVALDGREMRVKHATTAVLLDAIGRADWISLVPGLLCADDRAWIDARLVDPADDFELPDLFAIASELGGMLAGTNSWWAATRLLHNVRGDWLTFEGWAVQHNYDPLSGPLWRITAAALALQLQAVIVPGDPERTQHEQQQLREQIWRPPLNAPVALWTPADEAAAFRESMAAISRSGIG